MVFLSNHLKLAPSAIAAVYKDYWEIELFFEAPKQSLKMTVFVETSANALKTQIWTALIAMLLIKIVYIRSCFEWSPTNFMALPRQQLFVYLDS